MGEPVTATHASPAALVTLSLPLGTLPAPLVRQESTLARLEPVARLRALIAQSVPILQLRV